MLIVAVILFIACETAVFDEKSGTTAWVIATFLVLLGGSMMLLGVHMNFKWILLLVSPQELEEKNKSLIERVMSLVLTLFLPGLFFPLLLPFAPSIFICIKGIAVVKPTNQLLKAQSTLGGRGESILEAAPQFSLQCYIILLTLTPPGWLKWFSISTSALTLSLKNIEHYVTDDLEQRKGKNKAEEFEGIFKLKMQYVKSPKEMEFKPKEKCLINLSTDTFEELFTRSSIDLTSSGLTQVEFASFDLKSNNETFGPMAILKNIAVFLPASLFKVLTVSILSVFFKGGAMIIMDIYCFLLLSCLMITASSYNLIEEKDWWRQLFECSLSWLTLTNLGGGKAAAFCRLVSTLYWTIAHTITLASVKKKRILPGEYLGEKVSDS